MLYQTKLFVPPSDDNWVARPRLIAKLNDGLPCKMVLVSAPAGYGKTTCIAGWLNQIQQNKNIACWVSLDEEDSDPYQFFRYLAATVEPLPGVQTSLSQSLQSNQSRLAKDLIQRFIGDVSTVSSDFFLVLDDYHRLDSDEIDMALATLLDYMPAQMTLVMTSRSDPSFPISRLRAKRDIIEIRSEDLRFTTEEATSFFEQTMGVKPDLPQVHLLEEKTEGWIAGLQLAALALQGQSAQGSKEPANFLATFTGNHRYIFDYLVEEVFQNQTQQTQLFLLKTSVLNRLTAPLCDAITGQENGRELLTFLEQSNLFIIPLDQERGWYRYHHLFGEFLSKRLHEAFETAERKQLYQQAALWCDANGIGDEAIHYALQNGDEGLISSIAEKHLLPRLVRNEVSRVFYWTKTISSSGIDLSHPLQIIQAWALLFSGQVEKLMPLLTLLESSTRADKDSHSIEGHTFGIRSWLAFFRYDFEQTIELASQALQRLSNTDLDLATRSSSFLNLGNAKLRLGDLTGATEAYSIALDVAQRSGTMTIEVVARTHLADVLRHQGKLSMAEAGYHQAIAFAGKNHNGYSPAVGMACLGLVRLLLTWYRLDEAEELIDDAIDLFDQTQNGSMLVRAMPTKAQIEIALGNLESAQTPLKQGLEMSMKFGRTHPSIDYAALQAQIHLLKGNTANAYRWANDQMRQNQTVENNATWALDRYKESLALSGICAVESKSQAKRALELLADVEKSAVQSGFFSYALQAKIVQAVAWQTLGEQENALQMLADALADAEPEAFVYFFVKEGQSMRRLLRLALRRNIYPDFVRKLLAKFPAESTWAAPAIQPLHDPLSKRELEVLALLAEGDSNAEIANKLVITVGTTKRHVSNILGKLSVSSRTQAVAAGRDLGLI